MNSKLNFLDEKLKNVKISEINNFINYEEIIEKHTKIKNITDEDDTMACKTIIDGINKNLISENLSFKIVSLIISHLSDFRSSFVDRGCFLATAFYKVDHFDARKKESFKDFESLLINIKKEKIDIIDKNEIKNNYNICKDYKNLNIFDSKYNPKYIQNIIKILKSSEDYIKIENAYFFFEEIINKTSKRTLDIYSDEIYNILIKICDSKYLESHFKCLSYFLSKNFDYFERSINLFKESKLETLKVYLIFAFDNLCDNVDLEQKIHIHLRFAEVLMESDTLTDIVKNYSITFIEKGMKILSSVNN